MAHFADYDVERQPGSSHFPPNADDPEPLSLYTPGAHPHPSHPVQSHASGTSSNHEQHSSNPRLLASGVAIVDQQDPHDFYRQYRDSFRARDPSGIYGLGSEELDDSMERITSAMAPPRVSHFESRANGLPATSVTVRLNNLAKKPSQDGMRRDHTTVSGIPRGRQTSLKALVNKFEQGNDEVLPMPGSRSVSRSTSTRTSPATAFSARSFRARTPSSTPSEDKSRVERRISGADRPPFDGTGLSVKKRTGKRVSQELRAPFTGQSRRSSAQSTSNTIASHSMVNLARQAAAPQQNGHRPLFGEIVAGQADHGWGIPMPRRRRGSEGSLQRPTSMFRDDTELDLPQPSVESWYNGQGQSFDNIDFSRVQPRSERLRHQRSRSDLPGLSLTYQTPPPASSSAPRSRDASTTPTRPSRQSKLPVRSRAPSNTSEADREFTPFRPDFREGQNSRFSIQPLQPGQIPSQQHASSSNPRKSPRRAAPAGIHPVSLSAGAHDLETALGEPAKSPPLRSSRNRQTMAQASTSVSRNKMTERAATVGNGATRPSSRIPKALPELGGVDFAARRERIQRAFSKSVEEKEAEQRRSLILEAHRRKQEEIEAPPVPAIDQHHLQEPGSGTSSGGAQDDHGLGQRPDPASALTIDTERTSNLPQSFRRGSADDSPTLGALNLLPSHDTGASTPSDRRSSFASSGTYMDDEPQDSPALRRELHGELSAHPNVDGVHIVLGGAERSDPTSLPTDGRWSMSSWASSVDSSNRFSSDRTDARLESIHEVNDSNETRPGHIAQRSTSTNRKSTAGPPLWTPSMDLSNNTSSSSVTDLARDSVGSSSTDNWTAVKPDRSTSDNSTAPQHISSSSSSSQERQSDLMVDAGPRDSLSPHNSGAAMSKFAQRASLMNPADFAAASPSIGDWIAHQAEDTPVEEQSKYSFSDRVVQSAPQKPTGLRRPGSRPLTPKQASSPQLPEITTATSGDWGLGNIRANSPRHDVNTKLKHQTSRTPAPSRNVSGGVQGIVPAAQDIPVPMIRQRTSVSPRRGLISKYNSKADNTDGNHASERLAIRPTSALSNTNGDLPGIKTAADVPIQPQRQPTPPKVLTEEEQTKRDAEQKRVVRRKNIIKELVDTESSFGQDMTVVVDIYKETSHVILQNPDDVKTLFGNASEIVQFSMQFLDALKLAANSVYKLPRSKRWRSKRDSSATADSSNGDETSSISNMELTDDDRDRLTTVGACFEQHMTQMEKFYTEYLKNHESASAKLVQLQKSDKVQIWLTECRSYAHDLTTAWDLDSLLVKPVQRILKYPLLLRELMEVTPENHPDFLLLDNASREIVGLSQRINSAKKRADLVMKSADMPSKKDKKGKQKDKDEDTRNVFSKTFGRNKERLRNQVGLGDVIQDKAYNILADKFGSHFFQVQVVMRDVEVYTVDVQKWVQQFDDLVAAIEQFMDVSQTIYPEVESKWKQFRNIVREIQGTALTDHLAVVRNQVIEPMATLLKLYDGPQKMMEKRKKRILDHARWRAAMDAGGKVDKKVMEQGEQFVALNDTLKEELPKLFTCTKTLVEACLNIFIQLQLQWQAIWRRKLQIAIDMRNPVREVEDIVTGFTGDFQFIEAQMRTLGICNGTLIAADDASTLNLSSHGHDSSSTTLNGDGSSSRQTSLTYDDAREARMMVNQTANSRNRAVSANSQSAHANHNVPYYPAAYAQGPSSRHRANSTASGRSRDHQTWSTNSSHLQVTSPQGFAPASGRPSSQTQRTNSSGPYGQNPYDPGSCMRYSEDSTQANGHWYQGQSHSSRPTEGQFGIGAALAGAAGAAAAPANPRGSAIFSSALPPSDTPPQSAFLHGAMFSEHSSLDPNGDQARQSSRAQSQYNVLFLAASVYEFNIDRARREAGYPYLTYAAGEIFDVIGEKGELWLAKNQDDPSNTLGWIWNKHFAKLATES